MLRSKEKFVFFSHNHLPIIIDNHACIHSMIFCFFENGYQEFEFFTALKQLKTSQVTRRGSQNSCVGM